MSGEFGPGNINLQMMLRLLFTSDVVHRYVDIELRKLGSWPIRFAVLNSIVVNGGSITPAAIGKQLLRSSHAVTSVLDTLTKEGLVRRVHNVTDRRSVKVYMTEKGWEATKRIVPIAEDISKRILSCLMDDEIRTMEILLERLRAHVLSLISSS